MATTKWANDAVASAALDWIKANGPKMYVCTTAVSASSVVTYAAIVAAALTGAITTALASVSETSGDTSGLKLVVPQAASVAVTASGTAARVALVNSAGSGTATYITTCTAQVLTSGNTVTVPVWDIEVRDPV
jgi:hypothetical protein